MPAQKLTRGRFAQIIITLTLLIIAFTWRTMTHTSEEMVQCELKPNCTFDVNSSSFEITNNEDGSLQLTTTNKGWT